MLAAYRKQLGVFILCPITAVQTEQQSQGKLRRKVGGFFFFFYFCFQGVNSSRPLKASVSAWLTNVQEEKPRAAYSKTRPRTPTK